MVEVDQRFAKVEDPLAVGARTSGADSLGEAGPQRLLRDLAEREFPFAGAPLQFQQDILGDPEREPKGWIIASP